MGIAVIPAPSAGSKTLKRTTLTSGTTYTVPAGVTDINVTLYGGGGGGGAAMFNSGAAPGNGGTGGTTTFTGATSAIGGNGGTGGPTTNGGSYTSIHTSASATNNTGEGGQGGWAADNQGAGAVKGDSGYQGTVVSSTLTVTAGATIAYSIGAGGSAGSGHSSGGSGGSGKIEIEYWS